MHRPFLTKNSIVVSYEVPLWIVDLKEAIKSKLDSSLSIKITFLHQHLKWLKVNKHTT